MLVYLQTYEDVCCMCVCYILNGCAASKIKLSPDMGDFVK